MMEPRNRHLVLFGDGDAVTVSAEAEPVRFLLISGKPIGERIAWYGTRSVNSAGAEAAR